VIVISRWSKRCSAEPVAWVNGRLGLFLRGCHLLHGWPETADSWARVAPRLAARGYRVIAPDLRGVGQSERATGGYEKDNQAQDLKTLLLALGHEGRINLVGHDIGGMVTFSFARLYPDAVRRLVFAELAVPGLGLEEAMDVAKGGRWHFGFFMAAGIAEMLIEGREEQFLNWWMHQLGTRPEAWSAGRVELLAAAYRGKNSLRSSFEHYRTLLADGAVNRAWANGGGRLTMPVLTIGAEHGVGDRLRQVLGPVAEDLTSAVIEGSGHFVAEEAPDEMVGLLTEFFESSHRPDNG
jgi:pimeloyl-ACP methyl ester carboxylesterase